MQAILFRFVAQGGSDSDVKLRAARAEAEANVDAGGSGSRAQTRASPAAPAYLTATERRLAARQEKIDAMRRRGEERRREEADGADVPVGEGGAGWR